MTTRRRTAARSMDDLDRMLDDLVARVGGMRHAVVLSPDGAVISASGGLSPRDAEHLAAVASGFHGLARSADRRTRGGPARQTVIDTGAGRLFVAAVAGGACLAVLTTEGADPAAVAAETDRAAERVVSPLPVRPGAPGYPEEPAGGGTEDHSEGTRRCER
ncbi:roadblock/LC7 domain-containing protein [Streptomyces sp. NPDC005322]|uniref:roadblock/LC7 domain-containing protein n=1 Tax=unclassified Streptomyces TaxID=2593676 RepID=UPI0033B778E8